jgi:Leucine-rich repeat (LRR) protein
LSIHSILKFFSLSSPNILFSLSLSLSLAFLPNKNWKSERPTMYQNYNPYGHPKYQNYVPQSQTPNPYSATMATPTTMSSIPTIVTSAATPTVQYPSNYWPSSSPSISKPVVINNVPQNPAAWGVANNKSTPVSLGDVKVPQGTVVNNQIIPTNVSGSEASRIVATQPNYVASNSVWPSPSSTQQFFTAPPITQSNYSYGTYSTSPVISTSQNWTSPSSLILTPVTTPFVLSTSSPVTQQSSFPTLSLSPSPSPTTTHNTSPRSHSTPNYLPSSYVGPVSSATAFIMGKNPTPSDTSGRWRTLLNDPTTKSIDISNQHLSEIPSEVLHCTRLQVLKARYNKLSKVSRHISNLVALILLDLRGNNLHKSIEEIGTLHSLQSLDLGQNELSELPVSLTNCTGLVTLLLDFNHFNSFPSFLSVLTKLQVLHINNNCLTTLASELCSLTALRELGLSSNRLTELPANFTRLNALEWLDLSNNQLSALPPLPKFTRLHTLYAAHNSITCVSPDISALVSLRYCQLQHNLLCTLPQEFWTLTKLVSLELQENQLTEISPRVSQLLHLTRLNVSANRLETLPYQLSLLPNLLSTSDSLDLRQNPLPTIPSEIVAQGSEAIISFLRLVNKQNAPWRRVKLVFVGDEKVGKTSLLKVFAQHHSEVHLNTNTNTNTNTNKHAHHQYSQSNGDMKFSFSRLFFFLVCS